jgi:hypothetical protein
MGRHSLSEPSERLDKQLQLKTALGFLAVEMARNIRGWLARRPTT